MRAIRPPSPLRAVAVLLALAAVSCGGSSPRGGAGAPPGEGPAGGLDPGTTTPPGSSPGTTPDPGTQPPRTSDAIKVENALSGAASWRLTKTSCDAAGCELAGYARATSVAPGETIEVAIASSAPTQVSWVLYRLGWYGGASAREVARGDALAVGPQPPCEPAPVTGLVECGWPVALRIASAAAWPSGAYVVRLTRADGFQRFVPVVLRASRGAPVRMILPTATWQAYNTWGGAGLYDVAPEYAGRIAPRRHAVLASYDRPYHRDGGAGHLLRSDLALVRWLEAQGLDVEYLTDEDVDRDPRALDGARVVVLSGHDEYWSGATRDRVDAAVARGTSLLNMGANNAYWQVRYAAASADAARDRRIVVGYKEYALSSSGWAGDPVGPTSPSLTVRFRDAPVSRPENALLGVMFAGLYNEMAFPAVVSDPAHWTLAGTGLAAGDALPFVHGYETDDLFPATTPAGVEPILRSSGLKQVGGLGGGTTVVRRAGTAWVFSSGGIGFSNALSDGDRADPRAQRLVWNVLGRMLGGLAAAPPVLFDAARTPILDGGATAVRTVASGLGAPVAVAVLPGGALAVADAAVGRVLRLAGGATTTLASGLQRPAGLAVDGTGSIYASDAGAGAVLKIDPQGVVTRVAGPWVQPAGLAVAGGELWVTDLGGSTLRAVDLVTGVARLVSSALYLPSGVAVAADGTAYVVETGNRRVVRIDAAGGAVKVAGGPEGFRDGAAATAQLLPMYGIAALADGSLAVADPGNYRVRRIAGNRVTTLAGSGRAAGRDGAPADADLVLPAGLAVADDGTIYVAEAGAGAIRAIAP